MRIALHVDGPTVRGNERQALLLARGLRDRGHAVVASCRRGGDVQREFEAAGIRTSGVRPRGDLDLWSLLGFSRWLRSQNPDVLLLTSWKRAFVAALAGRIAGVPRIVLRVGLAQEVPAAGIAGWKYRRTLERSLDALLVNSPGLRDYFVRELPGLRAESVYVVPNALDRAPEPPCDLRGELELDRYSVVVTAAGGLEDRKGFDLLLAALARIDSPDVHLAIAGSGPLREPLIAQARSLGIDARVHFLGQRSDVPALLAASDVFVLSSRRDSMANVLIEAMQAGPLVVATDVHGTPELLAATADRGAAGWIVPVEDVGALAAALAEAVAEARSHGPEGAARREEARYRVEHWLSPRSAAARAERALMGLAARPGAALGPGEREAP